MWSANIEFSNKYALISKLAIKHKISFFGYPLHSKLTKNSLEVTFYGWTNTSSSVNKAFYDDLTTHSDVLHAEFYNQSIIVCIKQPVETQHVYSSDVIYLKPILVRSDGVQEYVLGAWDRSILENILKVDIPQVKSRLKKITQKPIENIGLFAPVALTNKQKNAFHLAQKNKYYSFPKRNIHLNKLAKKSKVSLATYQAHLRKAEQKILNSYLDLE